MIRKEYQKRDQGDHWLVYKGSPHIIRLANGDLYSWSIVDAKCNTEQEADELIKKLKEEETNE